MLNLLRVRHLIRRGRLDVTTESLCAAWALCTPLGRLSTVEEATVDASSRSQTLGGSNTAAAGALLAITRNGALTDDNVAHAIFASG